MAEGTGMELKEHLKKRGVEKGISQIISLVAEQSKVVKRAFHTHNALSGTQNVYGEQQLELDKHADRVFTEALRESGIVRTIASEEQGEITEIEKAEGEFGVTLDPLDGSSCVDTNLSVGTIVGIFDEGDVLEKGGLMDAACFVLYGPLTTLTYSAKDGVHEFAMDEKGEFVLRKENMQLPDGMIYSPGGLRGEWLPAHARFIGELEKEKYKLRFSGSFAADFNQILNYGGVFCYPATKGAPEGKLRLLFEANPMAFIAAQAGGASSNGVQDILSIKPRSLAQRVPLYIGGKKEIQLAEKFVGGKKGK
ncbi:MAG: class 1 fructose-bisphosphatase [Candidatus Diapherotrites archaeon]